jgi:HemY protein
MRYILLIILAAALAYAAMFVGQISPGNYVKIYAGSYVAELNLLGFIIALVLAVLTIYVFIKLFAMAWKAPKSFSSWRQRSNTRKASNELGIGYLSLIKGDWKHAEKHLTTKSEASQIPYVNFLAAAQAAQEQGRMTQRDDYLNMAFKAAPKERLAIGLIKARLHQSAGQYDQAEATLDDIADLGHKNAQYTAMLLQTYQHTGQWQKAYALLVTARKQHALPEVILDDIANQAYAATLKNANDIESAWKELPKAQRKLPVNVHMYAASLIKKGEMSTAEKIIRSTLKNDWSDELVDLYATINTGSPSKLRRQVEGWLMARPESASLNLAAGQFAMQEKNSELAKGYLQKAIQLAQLPKAYSLRGEW